MLRIGRLESVPLRKSALTPPEVDLSAPIWRFVPPEVNRREGPAGLHPLGLRPDACAASALVVWLVRTACVLPHAHSSASPDAESVRWEGQRRQRQGQDATHQSFLPNPHLLGAHMCREAHGMQWAPQSASRCAGPHKCHCHTHAVGGIKVDRPRGIGSKTPWKNSSRLLRLGTSIEREDARVLRASVITSAIKAI